MIRKGWSYKEDRRLSELPGSGKTLEQIAKAMDRTPDGDDPGRRFAALVGCEVPEVLVRNAVMERTRQPVAFGELISKFLLFPVPIHFH
jgi:hypothetical protein